MSSDEQRGYLAEKAKQRREVQGRISELVEERDTYLANAAAKREAEGKDDAFDERVFGAIRSQAAKKGIRLLRRSLGVDAGLAYALAWALPCAKEPRWRLFTTSRWTRLRTSWCRSRSTRAGSA